MIHLMTEKEARHSGLPPSRVHCISPYLNPAHVLSPPRHWLEALHSGKYSWPFFRLRYKNLLRQRFKAEPARFFAMLDLSEGTAVLALTCHCQSGLCHRQLAREFLEHVRGQRPVTQPPLTAPAMPPARQWAHRQQPGVELALLIEHPRQNPAA